MYSKPIATVFCLYVLCALASTAAFAADDAETRTPGARQPAAIPLPQELATLSNEMLRIVNEGRRPSSPEIAAVSALLLQNRQNLLRYDEPGKVKYFMLSAWNSYFAGDHPAAVQAAQAGLRSGPEDPDMRATYAAIAMATENYPMIGRLAPPARPAARRRGAEETMETPAAAPLGSGILNFDMQAFKPMGVSRKLSMADTTLRSIGGARLVPADLDLLCMLVYKTVGDRQTPRAAQTSYEDYSPAGPPEGDPGAAFGALMTDYADSGKVGFIGVSLDDAAATYNAMRETSARGWFWPQVMARQEANKALADLARFSIDAPTMAIVTKDGTIAYLGSPVGFIPRLLLAKATNDYTPQLFVPIDPTDPNVRRARIAADPNAMRRRPADPNAPRTGRADDDAFQTAADAQAERLYETAKSFLTGQRTTTLTAGSGIQLCRQILESYPHTESAAKARELLRDLPDEIKQRYNITNAEMGL